jgi:bifunctional non-homologous end joining protein LigD
MRYIPPAQPALRAMPPTSARWLHEVKFDGWRVQLHKRDREVAIYTKGGHDYTRHFPLLAVTLTRIAAHSIIIDGELVACDKRGLPDFRALHFRERDRELCVWAFDLLHLNGKDLTEMPLMQRKFALEKIVYKTSDDRLRLCEHFDDGLKLLRRHRRMPRLVAEGASRDDDRGDDCSSSSRSSRSGCTDMAPFGAGVGVASIEVGDPVETILRVASEEVCDAPSTP